MSSATVLPSRIFVPCPRRTPAFIETFAPILTLSPITHPVVISVKWSSFTTDAKSDFAVNLGPRVIASAVTESVR